jgi:hypothetical protein
MGVIAYYARLTTAELAGLIHEPARFKNLSRTSGTPDGARKADPSGPRFLTVDKAWDRIGYILDECMFPIDIVHGENYIPAGSDWGPPGYLTAEQVREAADELGQLDADPVAAFFATNRSASEETDRQAVAERAEAVSYVSGHYSALKAFVEAAAKAGDAMIMWRY